MHSTGVCCILDVGIIRRHCESKEEGKEDGTSFQVSRYDLKQKDSMQWKYSEK